MWIGAESGTPSIYCNAFYLLILFRIDIVIGVEGGTPSDCRKSGKIKCLSMIWVGSHFRRRFTIDMGLDSTASTTGKQDGHFVRPGRAAPDLGGDQCQIIIDFQRTHPTLQPISLPRSRHAGSLNDIRCQRVGDRGYHCNNISEGRRCNQAQPSPAAGPTRPRSVISGLNQSLFGSRASSKFSMSPSMLNSISIGQA
jgi:hypothetical protein